MDLHRRIEIQRPGFARRRRSAGRRRLAGVAPNRCYDAPKIAPNGAGARAQHKESAWGVVGIVRVLVKADNEVGRRRSSNERGNDHGLWKNEGKRWE